MTTFWNKYLTVHDCVVWLSTHTSYEKKNPELESSLRFPCDNYIFVDESTSNKNMINTNKFNTKNPGKNNQTNKQ